MLKTISPLQARRIPAPARRIDAKAQRRNVNAKQKYLPLLTQKQIFLTFIRNAKELTEEDELSDERHLNFCIPSKDKNICG